MLHLQVNGGVERPHDKVFFQRETGSVHEVQQNRKAVGVGLRVQADDRRVRVDEDGVEEAAERENEIMRFDFVVV